MTPALSERYVSSLQIEATSLHPLIEKYIRTGVQSEDLNPNFFFDFSPVPFQVRALIDQMRSPLPNLIGREGNGIVSLAAPVDYAFFAQCLEFDPVFDFFGEEKSLKWNPEPYFIKMRYSARENRLQYFGEEKHYLLLTSVKPFVLTASEIRPAECPFGASVLQKLFTEGAAEIDNDLRNRILAQNWKNSMILRSVMELPERIETGDLRVVIDYTDENDVFRLDASIRAFTAEEETAFPIDFSELRKTVLLNEDLALFDAKNRVLTISHTSEFYDELKKVLNAVRNNFYELLGEIDKQSIQTRDNVNLFQKFLPEIGDIAEIRSKGKRLKLVHSAISERRIEFSESEEGIFGGIDWLGVDFRFSVNEIQLNLNELKQIIRTGSIQKDDHLVTLQKEDIEFLKDFFADVEFRQDGDNHYIRRYNLPRVLKYSMQPVFPDSLKTLTNELENHSSLQKIKLPPQVSGILRNYQKVGVYWMNFLYRYHFGGILADEMGLGKTLQALSFLHTIRDAGTSLIVCPTSLIYNWAAEIEKFFPNEFRYAVIDGNKAERAIKIENYRSYHLCITSYTLAHLDGDLYADKEFLFCIIDEAQHIKNRKAKRSQGVKEIKALHRVAITGTPFENNIGELWSIFDFLMPEFLGSYGWFRKRIEQPFNAFDKKTRKEALDKLRSYTEAFIMRRTKSTVYKELPEKIEQTVMLELTEKQKAVYLDTLNRVRNSFFQLAEVKGLENCTIEFLAALTKLRQICLHPALVAPEMADMERDEVSVKLAALIELLDEAMDSGHRVLIFSQFVQMLTIIRKELWRNEIEYLYIDGKTKNRVELADDFNKSDVPVFLISLKAGGTGLNLAGADSVILFDPWWNPAVENQAIDRAHRIGQKKTVNVYKMMTHGTIEEKIAKLQTKKQASFDAVIENEESFLKRLSLDDIKYLFEGF